MADLTPEGIERAAARPLPAFLSLIPASDAAAPPSAARRPVEVIVNEHSRRFPRTLQQAFKQSEGYRSTVWHYPAPAPLLDRLSWSIILGLAGWLVWWCIVTPKGGA